MNQVSTALAMLIVIPFREAAAQSTQPAVFSIEQLFRLRASNHLVSLVENRAELNLTPAQSTELDTMKRDLDKEIDAAATELRPANAPPEQWLSRADEIRRKFFESTLMPWQTANADVLNRMQRIERLNEKVYLILHGSTQGDILNTATKAGLEPAKAEQAREIIGLHRQAIQARNEVTAKRDEEMRNMMPAGQMNLDQYKRETELVQLETYVQMQRTGSAVRRGLRDLLPENKQSNLDLQLSM